MFWAVNGTEMPCPSTFQWGLMDVSKSESGRTEDAKMHKNRIAQKVKLTVGYTGCTAEVASTVLRAINPEYITVSYPDLMAGGNSAKEFYVGDREGIVKWWWDGKHILESLQFDLIER